MSQLIAGFLCVYKANQHYAARSIRDECWRLCSALGRFNERKVLFGDDFVG
jgi:hypothetical protein